MKAENLLPIGTPVKWVAKPELEGKIYAYDTGYSFDYFVIWDNGNNGKLGKHRSSDLIVVDPNELIKEIL